jgi:hypothetical protein
MGAPLMPGVRRPGSGFVNEQLRMHSPDTTLRLCAAFPAAIGLEVRAALMHVPPCDHAPTELNIGPIQIAGEHLHIPYRIYAAEPALFRWKPVGRQQRLILSALYTRHYDGYVREKYVKVLLQAEETWVAPFVIQMLGEYVVEIVQLLELHLANLSRESYLLFLKENEPFFCLVRNRIASYWDCYYRSQFPRLEDYPAFRVAEVLSQRLRISSGNAAA